MDEERTEKAADDMPRYISIKQFVERSTLSRSTVNRRIKAGLIRPVRKDGSRVLIGVSALRSLGGGKGGGDGEA